jgi:hypothetical protein
MAACERLTTFNRPKVKAIPIATSVRRTPEVNPLINWVTINIYIFNPLKLFS